MSDHDLQDNKKKAPEPPKKEAAKVTNVVFDQIPTLKDKPVETKKPAANVVREEPRPQIDFFGVNNKESTPGKNEDTMFDELEKDFQKENQNQPFGKSITKEILQQSKKEIAKDLGDTKKEKAAAAPLKKPLEIEIEDEENYEEQQNKIQNNLNDKLQKMEEQNNIEDEVEEITEEEVIKEFDAIYNNDPELQQMLGEFPERYTLEEKLSIVQAYKKGGGVQGLADIIDDEDDDEDA